MAYNRQTFVDGQILTAAHLNTIENNIDERFKEAIVNPPTASIGQNLIVKSIDESGKPIEWEASDIITDETLTWENGVLRANIAETVDYNIELPVKSSAVSDRFVALRSGGRNLFIGTRDFSGDKWENWSLAQWRTADETFEGLTVKKKSTAWSGITQSVQVKVGLDYTLSAWIKCTEGAQIVFYGENTNRNDTSVTKMCGTDWRRVHMTFSPYADGNCKPRFENTVEGETMYICGLKLERSNIASDWSPAPTPEEINALPITGGTLSGDLKLTDGTNQRKINIYRNIDDSQYELQHSINYEGKGFFSVYKNSNEINMIKLGENSTEFSKPIAVSGGATSDVATQTRENLGITDHGVTPEMYGAVGTDTMSTETTSVDAQAFKKMINSGAKRFVFETGRTYHFYGVLRTWSFPEGAIIEGNGATLKIMDGAYGSTKTCLFTFGSNSEISNLNLDGATMIVNGSHIRVNNCHAINSRGNGFTVHMSAAKENNDIVFDKCTSDGSNGHGFAISNDQTFESTVNINGSHTNDIRYISCVARNSNNTIADYNWSAGFCVDYKGVWAEDVSEDYKAYINNILYTDCVSEENAESGYHCEFNIIESTNVVYRGCISKNNGTKESPEYGAGFLYRKGIIIDQCKADGCLTPIYTDEIESVNDIMNIGLFTDGFNYADFVTDKYSSNINRGIYYYGDITSNTIEQLQMKRINDTRLLTTGIDGAISDTTTGFISVANDLNYEHAKILTPIIPLINRGVVKYGLELISQVAAESPKNIQVSLVTMNYNLSNISVVKSTSLTPPVDTNSQIKFADEIAVSDLSSDVAYVGIFLDLLDGTTGADNSIPIIKNMYIESKIEEIPNDEDIIDLMLDMDMMPVVRDADGSILIDSDNAIILI